MGSLFRLLMDLPIFRSVLRPISRLLIGLIAIPIFRFIIHRVFRLRNLDEEMEKDLEEWFRGALLLFFATANMEHLLFGWMHRVDWLDRADWLTMGLRLMLAIGVIESMPDQELFAVLHPGPPKMEKGKNPIIQMWQKKWKILKGVVCRHLNRSSPVLAMMCTIIGAQLPTLTTTKDDLYHKELMICMACGQQCAGIMPMQRLLATEQINSILPDLVKEAETFGRQRERWLVGWVCYLMAITQYLIIGLVTSRDRALDVLSEFDRAVAKRREELIEEFKLEGSLPEDFESAPAKPTTQATPTASASSNTPTSSSTAATPPTPTPSKDLKEP